MILSIVTLRITTFRIMTFSIMTLSIMTISIMTLSIMTLSIMTLSMIIHRKTTFGSNDSQYADTQNSNTNMRCGIRDTQNNKT
jgi:hypothetical protein